MPPVPRMGWCLAVVLAGAALQLQQPRLWTAAHYVALLALGLCACAACISCRSSPCGSSARALWQAFVLSALAAVSFAQCGWRAAHFAGQALPPALEARDIVVTGVISDMPQRTELGLRFVLAVEEAVLDGRTVAMPAQVLASWYASGPAARTEPQATPNLLRRCGPAIDGA